MRIPLSLIGTVSELLAHHQNPAIPPVLEVSSDLTRTEPLIKVPPQGQVYPENFYSEKHRAFAEANRLEYKMTPFSVLESGLLSGFIKRTEQTGYTAQKPESVIEPLLRMTMRAGDLVVDPTAGSGTTGAVAARLGLRAILADRAPGAHKVMRTRLGDSLAATELP